MDPHAHAADERRHVTPVYHRRTVYEDDDLTPGQEYVVCSKCGARIKATRERCLRCFEPLHVDPAQLPVWRTLHISDRIGTQIAIAAGVAVIALIWVLWSTSDKSHVEAPAEPVSSAAAPPPSPAASSPIIANPAAGPAPAPASAAADVTADPGGSEELAGTRRAFEEKLKLDPNDTVALNCLGLVLARMGDQPGALAAFRHALEVAPRNATVRINLARLEGQMGQWSRAADDYRLAARLQPNDYEPQYNLGLALQQAHDDAAAATELETAIQLSPREPAAHRALANSYEKLGRAADAIREFRRYLELAPDAADANAIRERAQRLSRP